MRLRTRLSLFFAIVIGAGAATTLIIARYSSENVFRSFVFSGDSGKAKVYATILGQYWSGKKSWAGVQTFLSDLPQLVYPMVDRRIREGGAGAPAAAWTADTINTLLSDRVAVADGSGIIVADTSGKLLGTVHPPMHLAHGVPIMVDFERKGTVLVGSMVDSSLTGYDEQFLNSLAWSLAWATLLSAAVALVLGLGFSARITRPIALLTAAAHRVAGGDLSTQVQAEGGDEIAELSHSFNAMTAELRGLEDSKRRIIADSAHELRTPVTLIRGTIEAMMDGIYPLDIATLQSVHEETLRLSRLIDMLRELELLDSGKLELRIEELDLVELARRTISLFEPAARHKGVTLSLEAGSVAMREIRVGGDAVHLGQVLDNLVSNAMKYCPSGGGIRLGVEMATGQDPQRAVIRVEDSGPGVPAEERQRIFERFYRVDRSRDSDSGGRGLGLAIAMEIVKAHGGDMEVGESELGGACFTVKLPV